MGVSAIPSSSPLYCKICFAIVAGLFSHLMLFIHGEWHLRAPLILRIYILFSLLLLVLEMNSDHAGMTQAFLAWSSIITVYAGSIFGSMTIYRTLFHRLRGFPGPIFAKVTKLWHVAQVLDSKNYLYLSRLHRNYGDFVRTGMLGPVIWKGKITDLYSLASPRSKRAYNLQC